MNIRQLGFIPAILLMTLFLLSCRDLRWLRGLRGSVEKKLSGEWEGMEGENKWSFLFNKDGSFMVVMGNDLVFPPTSDEELVVESVSWEFDDTQDTIHLDCIVFIKYKESGETQRVVLPFIIRFIGQDKIQIRTEKVENYIIDDTTSPPTMYLFKRPTGFVAKSEGQLILTRQ